MYEEIKKLFPAQTFLLKGNRDFLKDFSNEIRKEDSDVFILDSSKFNMEDARILVEKNSILSERLESFLVYFDSITQEAHQALLKTLEEPSLNKNFFLITPHPKMLPETVLSRVVVLNFNNLSDNSVDNFISLKKQEKLSFIKGNFSGEGEIEERKGNAIKILDIYERTFAGSSVDKLKNIYEAKKMIISGNMSPKQVLEFVVTVIEK